MATGKWVSVNVRDRKKLKTLLKQHGNFEVVASLMGCSEVTLKRWLDSEQESRVRASVRQRLKSLVDEGPQLVGPLVAMVRETAFQGTDTLDELIKMRDALNLVIGMLQKHP